MPAATRIAEVIEQLEAIVRDARADGDSSGLFASLYLGVTKDVETGLGKGAFQDNTLMEHLDVVFANRYLDAFRRYREGRPCSLSWEAAFEATKQGNLLVIQHLLLGMNAHINLDLGIACAEVAPTPVALKAVEPDFMKINQLLAAKIDAVQDAIATISPLFFLADYISKRKDEEIIRFSLTQARRHAWQVATRLVDLTTDERTKAIAEIDRQATALAKLIIHPGRWGAFVLRFIRLWETKDVRKQLAALG